MPSPHRSSVRTLEGAFWVLFLCSTSGGLFAFGGSVSERAVWLLADLFALLIVASWPHHYMDAIARQAALFAWPALAIVSAIWSLAPFLSAYHGAQLVMTMLIGLALATRFGVLGLMKLLFCALALVAGLSLAVNLAGLHFAYGPFGEWRGTFTHKNQLGSAMVTLFYTSLLLFFRGWLRPVTAAFTALSVALMLMTQSTTSLLCILGLASIVPFLFTYRTGRSAFVTSAAVALAIGLLAAAAASADTNLVQRVLLALGKDETLTGRTTLWDFGKAAFFEAPAIGLGYKAYWDSPATSAGYLNYFIRQELWFFHNNFLEVAVSLGALGLAIFTAGLVAVVAGVVETFRESRSWESAWGLLFMAHTGVMLLVENPLFLNHSLPQVLFVAIAAGLRATNTRSVRIAPAFIPVRQIGTH